MQKIDVVEKELTRLLTWIQTADSRISLILPVTTVMLGALAALAPPMADWSILSSLTTSIAVIFLVLSISCIAFASFPRTNGIKGSLLYFGGINSLELSQYKKRINQLTEDDYLDDLVNQCYVNAQIAEAKYAWIRKSLAFLFLSSAPWFFSIYLLYGLNEV